MAGTNEHQRYHWLPVVDDSSSYGLVRHAFRGRRIDAGVNGESFCGSSFAIAEPSEIDWIRAPSCQDCNAKLKAMKG
ncbi:hypothetical protein F1721_21410 [Saccharopolyspora hirsuta]|uniref:Uncharacterized protein n=1 Tax=Saccharopolyspora hirsuta TaxID=1837 RepID=A0A5M7BMA6_SACHI|nr:hypothetical protein [Saccharopolyspora hirsuta]KAA5831296.1 hypothetical protein F1721_21410 [Saccharopolyspora hirsuta]